MLTSFFSLRLSPGLLVWLSILSVALADAGALYIKNITFHLGDWDTAIIFIANCIIVVFLLRILAYILSEKLQRPLLAKISKNASVFIELLAQWFAFIIVYLIFSYVGVSFSLPYQDSMFLAVDKALLFDWQGYTTWVEQSETARKILVFSYNSPWPQTPIVFLLLAIMQQSKRAYGVMLAFILAAVMCILIAAVCPSTGIITYLHINSADYPYLANQLSVGYQQINDLEQLRNGTFHVMTLGHLTGIITFPSYHAAYACILAWAMWAVKWLRGPTIILNGLVVASIPVAGGHYLADDIAGVIIAGIIIVLVESMLKRFSKPNI